MIAAVGGGEDSTGPVGAQRPARFRVATTAGDAHGVCAAATEGSWANRSPVRSARASVR